MRPPIASQLQLPSNVWRIGLGAALSLLATAWILVLPFPINLALVPAVLLALGYLLQPALAPLLLVLSVPVQTAGAVSMGGSQITATKLALAATVLAVLIYLFARRLRPRGSVILIPFFAYLLTMFISLRNAVSYSAAFTEIYRWVVTLFAFVLVLYCIRSRRALLAFPPVIALGVYFEVGSGTVQSIFKLGPSSFAVTQAISRAYGTFGKPNTYAGYLEMTGPLLIAVAIWSLGRARNAWKIYREARIDGMEASSYERRALVGWTAYTLWVGLAGLASLLGIALSFSRGAWLGILAGLAVMLLVSTRRFPIYRIGIVLLVAAFFASGAMHSAPTALKDRYAQLVNQVHLFDSRDVMITPKNFAAVQRMDQWQAGIGMFVR
ncbi:MAG TPA: O-antigen ligase family protein, partial [Thermomicrobiaceae bacterium]|nr:O-antigen ligase family protein [Thermomicrobiaceae bacterium]